jgi:hypothetical protein
MTTFDDANPSMTQFLFWKLNKAMTKRERSKEGTRALTWIGATIRLMTHLAGFGCLTFAGFTVNMTVGLIVAGFSFFVLSWLNSNTANRPQSADPTATRR